MTATPKHGHKPIDMQRFDSERAIIQSGGFVWKIKDEKRVLLLAIPYKNKVKIGIELDPLNSYVLSEWTIDHKNESNAQWGWDGNEDKPTLTPSLHAVGIWHGWVLKGQLVES